MNMKKIFNDPDNLVGETLRGFAAAHADVIRLVPGTHMIERVMPKEKGKVRFLMGNGAGHEPAVICWVGKGMFDMNVVGEIFTCASASSIYEGIKRLAADGPVLVAIQNHAGDVLNAGMAVERAQAEGLDVQSVLFYDDVASAPKAFLPERRGIGGMLFYTKIVGALAESGASMDSLVRMFEAVRDRTRTYAVAVTNCTHPVTGLSMFADLPEDEIELGMGVHGEGGGGRMKLPTAKALAKTVSDILIDDGEYKPGDNMLVLVNGSGAMTMMEMSILFGDIKAYLEEKGMQVVGGKAGNYLTTQELSGASVSFVSVTEEMLALWRAPCEVSVF